MKFEFRQPHGQSAESMYVGIEPEEIENATKYLQEIIDGNIKSMNISRDYARELLKELKEGRLSTSSVRAFSFNLMDHLDGKEGK